MDIRERTVDPSNNLIRELVKDDMAIANQQLDESKAANFLSPGAGVSLDY